MTSIVSLPSTAHPGLHGFGRADLQVHTAHGDGMDDARVVFERIELQGELDVVAITDHDDVCGALEAREVHARAGYHFDLVTGIEVTTLQGHLLALWVDEPVASFRSLEHTVAAVHAVGGLAVVPHPFSLLTRSIGRRTLERVLAIEDAATHPDGIEVANPVSLGWDAGSRARRLNADRWQLAETGGSDAHFAEMAGIAYTRFPGRSSNDLRRAILARRTEGIAAGRVAYRQIGMRKIARQQVRGIAVTPRKVLGPKVAALWNRVAGRFVAPPGR